MNQRRRTESLKIKFADGRAAGWAFGVGECFRMQLDITFDVRMDVGANTSKKALLGRSLRADEKVKRHVLTQGDPPAYSFDRGHVFHELRESDAGIRRSIVVQLARPDPGALIEVLSGNDDGDQDSLVMQSAEIESKDGFVDFEVVSYRHGNLITNEEGFANKERFSLSQSKFVDLLRTGQ